MTSVAWWWAIPGIALVIAVSWAAWSCRAFRTPTMRDSMTSFEERSAALDRVRTAEPLRHDPAADAPRPAVREPSAENP
ncbi:hypothetical protein [Embleya sp. NBC_00896]|uniref:hypothetical protein n=1 Tax=Embleya sp. NBC_00896 TaxID=2975961 RepID=UPI00386C66F6|nr:hypothetical protein OG928_12275 [Embleya sp. NBC_00896]